ncbi:hypothetical protein LTR84_006537 [Exophiala bonariae]|uniref:Uncharacterized protein n=1 Tax=Exophiala bonariae TaxID=1690606 RepID=A0AAV9N0C3_9EURO|nr:hypothetical protein LTR84_006537 [Exophiala bonariae]
MEVAAEADIKEQVQVTVISEIEVEEQAFASSIVKLEVDNEDLHLGGKLPKELTENTARAISSNVGRSGVRGDVIYLQHGKYKGKPATLLAFKFHFAFEQNSTNRFSHAEIRVAFDSSDNSASPGSKPAVRHYSPALLCGPSSTGQITKSISVSPSITTPTAPVQIGIEVPMTRSTTVARDFQMKIVGEPWASDEDAEDDDMVRWKVDENYAQADGVPTDLKTAVLVQHTGEAFHATVHIKARTRMGISLFGWPWSKPTPLVVSNKSSFGAAVLPEDFSTLEEHHWLQLTEFHGRVARIRVSDTSKEKLC